MPRVTRIGRTLGSILLLPLLLLSQASCWAESLKALVVLSDNSAPYQSFASALNTNLPASIQVAVLEHPEQLSSDVRQADLIIAVGFKAAELAASQSAIPVLAVMVPKTGYEAVLAKSPPKNPARKISAIYLDQPWDRQIDFWRAAVPDRLRIGLLHAPDTRLDIASLRQAVARKGGSLAAQAVHSADELFATLESVLSNSDVLLAIPDSSIYSSSNIRNILLTSYRHGVPLIGLSPAYVNAGALCAIFSTPEQLAVQASATVISFARTGQLTGPQYPDTYTIAVNQQVARSLGVKLPSPEAIRGLMDKTGEHE